jgi:hypothetical protein
MRTYRLPPSVGIAGLMAKIELDALMAVGCAGDPFIVSMRKTNNIGLVHHVFPFF